MEVDHIEIYVDDRTAASQWYGEVLGFHPVAKFAHWADGGPLMLTNATGQLIALFEGPPQRGHSVRGLRRIAFRASANDFAKFIKESARWSTPPLGLDAVEDHEMAVSVYFTDPFGTQLEVTTYEYEQAKQFVDLFAQKTHS